MLGGVDDRAINTMHVPIELPGGIGLRRHGVTQMLKDPGFPPALDAARHRTPGAVALRHVVPGGSSAEHPPHPVEDAAVVGGRSSRLWCLRWKEWLKPLPLCVGQVSSRHSTQQDSACD